MNQRHLEYATSAISIAAIFAGSTTRYGSVLGMLSCAMWWTLTFKGRLWGLMPANVGGSVAYLVNVVRAFG